MINQLRILVYKYSELFRYGIVGGLNIVFSLALFWVLESHLRMHYLIANTVTWIVSVLLLFFANKFIVFKIVEKDKLVVEMFLFFGTRAASGVIDMALLYALVDVFSFDTFLSKCIVLIAIIIVNYVTAKLIVFRKSTSSVKK